VRSAPRGSGRAQAKQASSEEELDCVVARAPRNDGLDVSAVFSTSLRAQRSNPVKRLNKEDWIASSQGRLAMTDLGFPPSSTSLRAATGSAFSMFPQAPTMSRRSREAARRERWLISVQEQTQIIASAIGRPAAKAPAIVKVNATSRFASGRNWSTDMSPAPPRG
jgi:hypothetical protein